MSSCGVHDSIVEKELRRFSNIVEKHSQELDIIKETLEPYALPSWHPLKDLVSLKLQPFEFVSDFDLISTDNQLLDKTVLVLTSLCTEMATLADEAEEDFFIPLCLYGSQANTAAGTSKEYPHLTFSKILSVLDKVNSYIQHVKKVVWNVCLQLNVLHSNEKNSLGIYAGAAHFQVVFEHLGRVLGTLVVLDEIISSNIALREHFTSYKKLLKSSLADPSSFSSTKRDLDNLKAFINDIDTQVLCFSIYKKTLSELARNSASSLAKNSCFREEMLTVILGWSSQIENTSSEGWWCELKGQVLAITALSLFYQIVFDTQERKIAKELIVLYKKVPCISIALNQVWMGEKYINFYFPKLHSLFEKKNLDSLHMHRKNYLANKTQSLASEVQITSLKILGWSARMEAASKKPTSLLKSQDLDKRAALLWQGLITASSLKYTAESVLGLHTAIGQPMSKQCVISFCQLLESLKAVEFTYHYNISMLAETLPHLRQYLSYQLLTLLKNAKTRAKNERKLNHNHILDLLSALTLAERVLSGNGNAHRLLIARIALSLATQDKIISDDDLNNLLVLLRRLTIASDIEGKVKRATSTEFLYHHLIIFKIYLQDYMDKCNSNVDRIHFMLAAVSDSEKMLENPKELPERELLLTTFKEEIEELLKSQFLDKLCEVVETELRLHSHSHLDLEKKNPFEKPLKQIYALVHLQPLYLFGSYVCVKDYVEQYLEKIFYSMTVVAPHNCTTYELMRNLARSSLGLTTVDSHLPSNTLDQGVDVLEIMRNINIFVQHYHYNLNQQFFVEMESNNKHLNTVSIKHIANSIRTHGTGIINTTVNFTYQFLRRKFHVFSQFLYDEHIKSRLLKDLQYWKEVKEKEKSFPYERANKFHRGIRKLGLSSDGLSYLDQFRKLITHIGNAIGYVRLVRSGCLHCISESTQFIPDLQDLVSFSEICQEDKMSQETAQAAKNLDAVVNNLTGHFQKETDYFKIMVDVFSTVLREPKNAHLKNFSLIIPPLTINYIEYFIGAKDNLFKKNRVGATFTDDGFAIGVAYILKVLNQNDAFDSLHWWSGVRRKFIAEMERVEMESVKAKDGDAKLQQTLSLSLRRLNEFQRAFELLFLSVSSAQVFFKDSLLESKKQTDSTQAEEVA